MVSLCVLFLVRFGEIHLKSRYVRKQFQNRLVANIQDHFAAKGVECLTSFDRGRIYIETDDEAAAKLILKRVFGIVSFSPAIECLSSIETISKLVVDYAAPLVDGKQNFAIKSRRVGTHPFTSRDVAVAAGKVVQKAFPTLEVDLTNPDVRIHVEVRQNRAFIFHEVIEGPGGMPLGSQGRVLALVDNDYGVVAAWMMMKRGCKVLAVTYDSEEQIAPLRNWDLHLKVQRIRELEELGEIAKLNRANGVAVGWSLEEVEERKGRIPEQLTIFHPAVGLSERDVEDMVRRICDV